MFSSQESTPWYQSLTGLIATSVILPPVGLVLLWMRKNTPMIAKVLGSVGIVILAGVYFQAFKAWRGINSNEAQFTALEQHRAQQQAAGGSSDDGCDSAGGSCGTVSVYPASLLLRGASTEAAAAHATRNYWTNFRGPNRDGRYDEMAVLTKWPANGLTPIWKQPIGIGYASFVVADGRAYTIEQRRRQEVVSAYDVNTGRELWIQGWNAEYNDENGDGPRATPTWDEGRIYALGATGELRCLDAKTGAVAWGRNILKENGASNLQWAMAASPLIVDDKVIVLPGGPAGKSVVAYNKCHGRACLEIAKRSAGICVADAGYARRPPSDSGGQLVADSGIGARGWRTSLESHLGHRHGNQCFAANSRGQESSLYFCRLWQGRGVARDQRKRK